MCLNIHIKVDNNTLKFILTNEKSNSNAITKRNISLDVMFH